MCVCVCVCVEREREREREREFIETNILCLVMSSFVYLSVIYCLLCLLLHLKSISCNYA